MVLYDLSRQLITIWSARGWAMRCCRRSSGTARGGMTLMLVTHEMRFVRDVGTTLVFMHHGKVHEQGPPKQLFSAPRTPELQQFISAIV